MSETSLKPGTPAILGIPFDANSSFLRGTAGAPPMIRQALRSDSTNMWTENGVDLGAEGALYDAGDLKLVEGSIAFPSISSGVADLLDKGLRPICLGGDHSITYPVVRAYAKNFPGLTIVHFDAHPDLYDELDGNRLSHACPFARILEERLAARLIQVGIRTMNGHQRQQAQRFGVEVWEMSKLPAYEALRLQGPVYISFDMDVLDPAFAPGISHWEPGGMSVREAVAHLQAVTGTLVGADIVEYNPVRDATRRTAMVAAKILKEIAGKMWRP